MFLIFIAMSTIFGVMGQLSLKFGMGKIAAKENASLIKEIILSPWVIGGLATYGFGVLFWLMALSRTEVSYVYPFASLSYVGIIIGSSIVFHENINRLRLVGISVIILGVIIAGLSVN